jgi:putative transcriptional regulator
MEAIVNDSGRSKENPEVAARSGSDNPLGLVEGTNYAALEIVAGHIPKVGEAPGAIEVRLRESIAARGMTLAQLSQRTGVSVVNLSVLKNGHARAIRFSTLAKLCEALDCQPGDLLSWRGKTGAQQGQGVSRGGFARLSRAGEAREE